MSEEFTRREFTALLALQTSAMAAPALAKARGPAPPPAWRRLTTEPYKGKQDDIAFVDPDHGWYGNGKGKLYRTADGGESWTKVWDQPGTFIRALGFVDRQTGYLGNVGIGYFPGVTDQQPLYRTRDGGISWEPVRAPGIEAVAGICGIDVLPLRRSAGGGHIITAGGRVGGPAMLLRSEDDGASWRVIDLSAQAGMLFDIKFHDARTGFACASGVSASGAGDALILATGDGGQSWQPIWRSGRAQENCWKMHWPSRKVGYATVQTYDDTPGRTRVVIKTTDGGKSWHELPMARIDKLQQFGIGFANEQLGWVGTNLGGFETRDGGRTWRTIDFGRLVNKIRVLPLPGGGQRLFAIGSEVHRLDLI